jgi:hypothetical protein
VGGNGYTVRRKAGQLTSVNGYTLHGTIRRQLGRRTSIGATYQHLHYDFAKAFGEADINMYAGLFRRQFGRSWTLDLMAGIFASQVQGVQSSAVDPVIAALLGVSSVRTIFYKENMLPTATVNLTRAFRRSSLTFNYGRSISPGNGLYLTSRIESYGGTYSYTSRDRWSLSMSVSKGSTDALAQTLQRYRQLIGSANLAYRLGHGLSLNAMYANRRQDIQGNIFQQDSSRISVGIYFRPGDIPISFH